MIKKLRLKFICVVMVIVLSMLGSILGVVIHFTCRSMEIQSVSMMRRIASTPFPDRNPMFPGEGVRLPYFIVQVNSNGHVTNTIGSYFDLSDEEDIQQIVTAVWESDQEIGKLPNQNLRYLKNNYPIGTTLVFADTTTEATTMRNLVYSCILIFLVAAAIFLGISILLSQWVIKPVATAWDRQKQFVADASHELKTPLSVIMANAELMQNDDFQEDTCKEHAGNILTMTYQMRSLVENMLEMARLDNGQLKTAFDTVDFTQLVWDAVLSFQLLYEEKEMILTSNIQEGISLQGSEQHLFQVLDVLLDNALKYSTSKGTVSVTLSHNGRTCLLTVSSPGEPFSKEDLQNIFKRFYRGDKARSCNGSYGLGLSIAEAVVHSHKGKIKAHSNGGYNIFSVQLPTN